MIERIRKKISEFGLSPNELANALSFGFTFGCFPVYIPWLPTLILAALAKAAKMSVPVALVGLQIATPFFLLLLLPFVRVGEFLVGNEPVVIATLVEAMQHDTLTALSTFGQRLGLAALAWLASTPLLFGIAYTVFLPTCFLLSEQNIEPRTPPLVGTKEHKV